MNINVEPRQHGGDVWNLSRKYNIPIEDVIDFSAPINFLGPPPKAIEAVKKGVDVIKFYPDQNPVGLKSQICEYVKKISPTNVILGNGSMELIYLFVETFVQGGEIIIPVPSFTEYEKVSLLVSAEPRRVSILPHFSLDVEAIKKAINANTRLLFICNPHSPSGKLYNRDLILGLLDFCYQKNIHVVVDENYIDFVDTPEEYTLAHYSDVYDNLFVVRSFSKFFGMPGIRIGYGVGNRKLIQILETTRPPWCINSLALIAAEAALRDDEYVRKTREYVKKGRKQLTELLSETRAFYVFPSETNFLLVKILREGVTAGYLREKLARKGILVRDCSDFSGLDESFLRITVRSSEENLTLVNMLREIMGLSKFEVV